MGKFRQFFTEFSAPIFPYFSFQMITYQWILTKFGMCIDNVEIWLGLLMGKLDQFLTVICQPYVLILISGQ